MTEVTQSDLEAILDYIQQRSAQQDLRVTQHAQQEMAEEAIKLEDVLEAIETAAIVENYPDHRRGACCLLSGLTQTGRPLHVVCTTAHEPLILITVYEPKAPKWVSPTKRRS